MDVFISWSGITSKQVTELLKEIATYSNTRCEPLVIE